MILEYYWIYSVIVAIFFMASIFICNRKIMRVIILLGSISLVFWFVIINIILIFRTEDKNPLILVKNLWNL